MNVRVPGDKSLSQRALIFAALAEGESRIRGLLHGGDAESTASALRILGADIPELPGDASEIVVRGRGRSGWTSPSEVLDLGNSGTGTRLLSGVLAGSGIAATLTGDHSLRSRPMRRIAEPLAAMGARFEYLDVPERLPMKVHGRTPLGPVSWESPVASAQVKSAVLLAALVGRTWAIVTEPHRSRDHTERFLETLGIPTVEHAVEGGWRVELRDSPDRIDAFDFTVPGDVSSAAFLAALAALGATEGPLTIENVGLNPTRTAFLDVLERMGAPVARELRGRDGGGGEPVGSLTIEAAPLSGVTVREAEIPYMIDELPLVAALGARAEGVTTIRNAADLRTKESDRIDAMVTNLRAVGVEVEEFDDGLAVKGTDHPLEGRIEARHDHRIAMAFGVLAQIGSSNIEIDDPSVADVSFPGFWTLLQQCTGR